MKLAIRLGLTYGLVFSVVLIIIGGSLFVTVREVVTDTVTDGLGDVARIAGLHVNRMVSNRWELLDRTVRIVELWMEDLDPSRAPPTVAPVITDFYDQPTEVTGEFVSNLQTGSSLSTSIHSLAVSINAEIALFEVVDAGLISVASSGPLDGERRAGYLWPRNSAQFALITADEPWVGREYTDGVWHLCTYVPLPQAPETYLRIAIPQVELDTLRQDLAGIDLGADGEVYVLDTSVNVVLHPDRTREGVNLSVVPHMREIAFGRSGATEYSSPRSYLSAYEFVDSMNWVVIIATTRDHAFSGLDMLTRFFLVLFGLAVAATTVVSLLLGRQISRPVTAVARRFEEIADGEASSVAVLVPQRGSSEIRNLARDFNRYVHRTVELNEIERREIALELQEEQTKALRAQINPHFLYNTLETIRFLIEMGDRRAVSTVQTLSDLFRVSLGNGDRFTTVEAEVRHGTLYFEIQRVRYTTLLTLDVHVPAALRDAPVLSFLLQPIVENAIVHGVVPSQRPGTVAISVSLAGDDLVITVKDDGVGISEAHLTSILGDLSDRSTPVDQIGLKNVHDRLRLSFGSRYGIRVSSQPGRGTRVDLVMPGPGNRSQ